MTAKAKIFISYSHRDKAYVDKLLQHLRVLERVANFDVWNDRHINPGQDWRKKIQTQLMNSQIAILIVSADYLASDWIVQKELPALLEQESNRGLRILPLLVSPSLWKHTPLAYYQLFPRNGQALSSLSNAAQDKVLVELVEEILATLSLHKNKAEIPKPTRPAKKSKGSEASAVQQKEGEITKQEADRTKEEKQCEAVSFFISHSKEDGDFAEILKHNLKKEGFIGWIDTDVLEAGADWRQEIDDAILSSNAVILVLSPEAKKSEYVTYEWAFALGTGLKIVPLMLKDTPIHPRLEIFQYLDFTNRRARPWHRLLSLLHDIIDTRELSNKANSADGKKQRG